MADATALPFSDGQPVPITPRGWLLLLASVALAFTLLLTLPFHSFPLSLITAMAYTATPLIALALVSRGHQTALFKPVGLGQVGLAMLFALLTIAASLAVGAILIRLVPMAANPVAASLTLDGIAGFMLVTAIQLLGEELMTIIPLLAVLWFCLQRFRLSHRLSLAIAVLVSTALFAAAHLPTYDWNLLQCFAGIGTARLVLTAAFLVTRNLWVSTGAHIINDWTEFLLPTLLLGHLPIGAGS